MRPRASRRIKAPVIREAVLQRQIAETFSIELAPPGRISSHGVTWWSVDMAAYAGVAPGLRTARGCIAGVPDMIVLHLERAHFIELKSQSLNGFLSRSQQDVATAILLSGARFGVARSLEEAITLLDRWEIPRAHKIVRLL
jgi:hypothetical protein